MPPPGKCAPCAPYAWRSIPYAPGSRAPRPEATRKASSSSPPRCSPPTSASREDHNPQVPGPRTLPPGAAEGQKAARPYASGMGSVTLNPMGSHWSRPRSASRAPPTLGRVQGGSSPRCTGRTSGWCACRALSARRLSSSSPSSRDSRGEPTRSPSPCGSPGPTPSKTPRSRRGGLGASRAAPRDLRVTPPESQGWWTGSESPLR
mmetsp:Transcript_19531/g.62184  ORF Transcript_19531/g.62184 Transcript_19531/m.62184 type:complete len:205 (-) Transcript_19531:1338-1952(-)